MAEPNGLGFKKPERTPLGFLLKSLNLAPQILNVSVSKCPQLTVVTIQGRVPFRRHHKSRRARLASRARGSYSYRVLSLRRIRRGDYCGWCGRGG